MSEIRVNTDDLRNNASTFKAEAESLNAALAELLLVLNSLDLGKYQSQLSDQVRSRVMPTQEVISSYQHRLQELAEKLNNKAFEFEQANTANMNDVTLLANKMYDLSSNSPTMRASAILRKINNPLSNRVWGWGGNFFGGLIDRITGIFQKPGSKGNNNNETGSLIAEEGLLEKTTETNQNQKYSIKKKYNPKKVLLKDANPTKYESCAKYAQARRPSLGSTGGDNGAYNYKFRPDVFQVDESDKDLEKIIAEGYAIIWDKDPNATTKLSAVTDVNAKWGHVAIVEEVLEDKIIISEANPPNLRKEISIDGIKKSFIYILPY